MTMIPEIWDDLVDLLDKSPADEWVLCTAWAVGGGDPDGMSIRLAGTPSRTNRFHRRATYEAAWCVCTAKSERVRLSRLDAMPDGKIREVERWLKPEDRVWVKRRV